MKRSSNIMELPDGRVLGKAGSHAEVRGADLYLEEHGKGEPLMLLHGAWSSVEGFVNQAGELCRQYHLFLPERRGHGRSPDKPGPFSYSQDAEDMLGLIDNLGLERLHLLGWSAGAIVGLMMVMQRPEIFSSFVSMSGTFRRDGFRESFLRWEDTASPRSLGKVAIEIYRRNSPDGPEHFDEFFRKVLDASHTHPNYRTEELSRHGVPTLIMAGDRDIVRIEHTLEYFLSLEDGQLGIIPGAGHRFLMERPGTVNRIILDFLGEHSRE